MTKKNSKKRISNWRLWVAGLLFIIAGLLFAAGPIRSYMLAQFQQEHTQQLTKVTAAEVKENETQEAEFDFSTVEPLDLQAVVKAKMDTSKFLTLGAIAVPSVNLNLPIYKGISNPVLLAGAGTMKPTQKMGEGNYALASHSVNSYGGENMLFTPLWRAQKGMKVYLTDGAKVYTYTIDETFMVSPSDTWVLDETKDSTVTLITCDVSTFKRVIIKGKLDSVKSMDDTDESVLKSFNLAARTF